MIDVMAVKLKVIKAACGICSLSEIDLLHRLEELYLEGVSEGVKVAKEVLEKAAPAPQSHLEQYIAKLGDDAVPVTNEAQES